MNGLKETFGSKNVEMVSNIDATVKCMLSGLVIRILVRRHSGWSDGNKGVEAGGGITGATLGAPNPSTDPLVASQYAPVRDAPPADDERRQLMDNKEW